MEQKMKVEIWSDVMCPFCYIGKHRFELALAAMHQHSRIEVEWKSFQLQPDAQYEPGKDLLTSIAELKGVPREQMAAANGHITEMAKGLGITFNFNDAKIANTFNALRLVKLAEKNGKSNDAEEELFKAFFTDGKVVSDDRELVATGTALGLDKNEIENMLQSDAYRNEVMADINEAREIGISGVPFFVFNRKYAISGAQPVAAFEQTLQKSFAEWQQSRIGN